MKYWLAPIPYLVLFSLFFWGGHESHFSRAPASDKIKNCYELIKSFYSVERNKILDTRLRNTEEDAYLFFRSFPPLFYKMIADTDWKERFKDLSKVESIMAGDVHMDNFGFKYFMGTLRLSVNDYDDMTKGPVFLDLVRHLVSAQMSGIELTKTHVDEYIEKFKKGLRKEAHELSSVTRDIAEESESLKMLDSKVVDTTTKKFIKKKSPNSPLSDKELSDWKALTNAFGKINDSYSFVKESGGSGGLHRFEFVIEKDGKTYWIEAKEWSTPSYDVANGSTSITDKKRAEHIAAYDKPEIPSTTVEYKGKTYLIRNIDARQIGMEIAKIKDSKKVDVLMDEAYALGDFHRYYLENPSGLIRALDEVSSRDVLEFVQQMAKTVKRGQKSIP